MGDWGTFFAAQVAASATLAGLLFVGVSLNLNRILSDPSLPDRALSGFYMFLTIMIVSSLMLLPDQPLYLLGLEVLIIALVQCATITRLDLAAMRRSTPEIRAYFVRHFVLFQSSILLYLIGAGTLVAGMHAGLYWLAAAIVFSLFNASVEAWVLLVEINR